MFLHQNERFLGKLSSVYIQMSPAHPEIMAQTRIYQACLPRKKAIQQPMLGISVQIKATRSIGGRVTVLPIESSETQSGSDPQSGDSGQLQPGRTRNTAPSHHRCVHSTAVAGAPLGRPVFVLGALMACKTIHGQAYLSRLFSCSCSPSFLPEGQSNQHRIFFSSSKFPPFGLDHFLPLSSRIHTHTHTHTHTHIHTRADILSWIHHTSEGVSTEHDAKLCMGASQGAGIIAG